MLVETTGTYYAENIRHLRKKYAISRRGLARLIGMSEYTLKEIEEKRRATVFSYQQMQRLRDVFGIPTEELVHKDLSVEL